MYDWKNYPLIPRDGLEAWHQFESGISSSFSINDYSGHDRHLICSSSGAPALTSDVLGGQPGWYFDGSSNPLVASGPVTGIKHIFVVLSFDEATFTNFRGVLSDETAMPILVSNNSGDTFVDQGFTSFQYRKSDVIYDPSSQKAPIDGGFAFLELIIPDGIDLDGIQIGQDTSDTARKHLGYFVENLMYSVVLTDLGRFRLLNYFAMRYHLWQRAVDAGPWVFPFAANRGRSQAQDRENFLSEPYDGPLKALVRGDYKSKWSAGYALRVEAEFKAAEAFFREHYPITDFIFRDWHYYPAKDYQVRFASPLNEQGADTTYRFNYTFDVLQTVPDVDPPVPVPTTPPAVPEGLRLTRLEGDASILVDWDWDASAPDPTVPVMTPATGVTDTVIHWNWNASTSDVPLVGYDLEIAEDSGFTVGLRTINLGNVLTYVDIGRTATTQYFARVRAHDAVPHYSVYSAAIDTTTEAPAFAPTDVSDLHIWLEPSDFLDQALADGDHIAVWNDSSGNGNNAAESLGSARPVVKLNIVNGWPVMRCEGGVYHVLELPSLAALTEGEAFIVLKSFNDPAASFAKTGIWKFGTGSGAYYAYSGDGKIYDDFGSTVRKDTIDTGGVDLSAAFHIYSVYSAAGDWQNYLDGVSLFSTVTNTVGFSSSPNLGCDIGAGTNFDGDIAEFLLYSRKLTGTERTNVIAYLTTKYGL
jgi:hypothetical protein